MESTKTLSNRPKSFNASALTFATPAKQAATVIRLQTYPVPAPANNEILVQLLAAPINPQDFLIIADLYPIKPNYHISGEAIPGYDGVGRIIEVGIEIHKFSVGDLVIPRSQGFGTWRTHAICDEESLIKVPNGLDIHSASILKMTVLPAYFLVEDMRDLRPGDWIIQNAATSTIAQMVSQFARLKGAHTISIFRDSPSAVDNDKTRKSLLQKGADVALSEYELAATNQIDGKRIVLALDSVWGASAEKIAAKMPKGGSFVNFGALSGGGQMSTIQLTWDDIFWRSIALKGYKSTESLARRSQEEVDDLVKWLVGLFDKGTLVMPNYTRIPWSLSMSEPEQLEQKLKTVLESAQGVQIRKKKYIFDFC